MSSSECFENPPILSSTFGKGIVKELGGLKTYVAGTDHSKLAIVLISDIFGYEAPNLRKVADKVAAAGFLVVVPDFFNGEPYDLDNPAMNRESWRKAHPTDKGYEDAITVIVSLREQGVTSIGAAGFCWGGVVVAKLAKTDHIQGAVILHPGRIPEDEVPEIKIPTAILGAEIDHASPPDQLKRFGEILAAKSEVMDSFVKIFAGVGHGWTMRYNREDKWAVKSAEDALQDMLNWFIKHVH
ncbi:endo-1,3;1,4-beta-D-glucanase-like [Impatiens glandulifera]|uniref:endo-1,3;1,4-beta-D-glucanase-like n=1 Tax=Impatiens glandulifera TaxID=253017 RepID=UPI001FB09963|nr:endo-1,3;1,4-beta-D-glucanase-like [Impatiens glandulifera]